MEGASVAISSNNAAFGGSKGDRLIKEIWIDDACKVSENFHIVNVWQ